ncbi:MAG TPA: DUF1800 domain-containing protein, partial [Candidatus Baltobacteraceae bacterium]|nr:DUF1800 domain-containing protein [Candidatus Baltobacteraceae bacterium]
MLKPLPDDRWNYETAAHLLNRAGFGGPPAEIQKLAALKHDQAVSYFLDYEKIPDPTPNPSWAAPDPEHIEKFRADLKSAPPEEAQKIKQTENRLQAERINELRGWWLDRMAKGPRPFLEKMVLFWHGHFATSIEKVRQSPNSSYMMWRQNQSFRDYAVGNWLDMLKVIGKDPAMLVWLDQAQSRKQHPNENFAREVMELFSLGEGHYTEHDITEAARALTGWSYQPLQQTFIYRPVLHDTEAKTIFGQTGNFDGDDFLTMIVAQPQAAKFITAKLWNFFAGQMPSAQLNDALAQVFRANGNNFKPMLRAMFRSEEFYDKSVVRNQVKSPVQWLIGSVRMLESELPPPFISSAMLRSLGQDLFAPPNVKGWDGGMSWITTNTLLTRYNDAATIVQGTAQQMSADDFARKPGGNGGKKFEKMAERIHVGGMEPEKILTPEDRADKRMLVATLEKRLLQSTLTSGQEK